MKLPVAKFRAFNRFYTPVIGLLDQHFLNSEFSLTEVRVLFELNYARDGITAKELIALLQLDKGYLSRILLQFEKRLFIRKEKSVRDGRASLLRLTAGGKQVFNRLDQASEQQATQMLQSLPAGDLARLIGHMNAIQTILSPINLKRK
jgi:DNA-binding MarR family transcriptional regulator